jgi:hypothetical protein
MEPYGRIQQPTEQEMEAFMATQYSAGQPDAETQDAAAIIAALTVPFRRDQISQRKIGGRMLDYVEGHEYITRLNEASPAWSFRMTKAETTPLHVTRYDKQRNPYETDLPCLTVYGEITIPGVGSRAGIGVQMIENNAGEDVMKGALTDCLKNCAKYFGLGLHMYSGDAPQAAQSAPQQHQEPQPIRPQNAPQGRPQQATGHAPMEPGTGGPATDGQKRALWAISNANKEQIDQWAAEYNESNQSLSKGTASVLIDKYGSNP